MVAFDALYICMAVAVAVTFVFGALRYSLAIGITAGLVALHDQLLTLAVMALVSIVLPQTAVMPILIVFSIVFTYCQSWPVIRAMHELRAANSVRDMDNGRGRRCAADRRAATGCRHGAARWLWRVPSAATPRWWALCAAGRWAWFSLMRHPVLWVKSAARFGKRK